MLSCLFSFHMCMSLIQPKLLSITYIISQDILVQQVFWRFNLYEQVSFRIISPVIIWMDYPMYIHVQLSSWNLLSRSSWGLYHTPLSLSFIHPFHLFTCIDCVGNLLGTMYQRGGGKKQNSLLLLALYYNDCQKRIIIILY